MGFFSKKNKVEPTAEPMVDVASPKVAAPEVAPSSSAGEVSAQAGSAPIAQSVPFSWAIE
mgnify:CR=1 FL=1